MNPKEPDFRWMAEAIEWVNKIGTVAAFMVLPCFGGMWLDRFVGSICLFTIGGMVFGFSGGMYYLLKITKVIKDDGPGKTRIR